MSQSQRRTGKNDMAEKVSILCLLLNMTFDPVTAQRPLKSSRCPTCLEGYFVMKNCSVSHGKVKGVQCKLCTNCSAVDQDTLVKCSTFADSLCGNKTSPPMLMPTELPVSAREVWILLPVIVLSLFLVLLLSLLLTLLSCRHRQQNKPKGLDLL
ncbi:hypothetical protein D9C73_026656 [Collichthys lucidus]|nr:hypothetical protein D9C73_026656 [Collichthys lucidus]